MASQTAPHTPCGAFLFWPVSGSALRQRDAGGDEYDADKRYPYLVRHKDKQKYCAKYRQGPAELFFKRPAVSDDLPQHGARLLKADTIIIRRYSVLCARGSRASLPSQRLYSRIDARHARLNGQIYVRAIEYSWQQKNSIGRAFIR
jgi:hypothetical protein